LFKALAREFELEVFTYQSDLPQEVNGRSFGSVAPLGYAVSDAPRAMLGRDFDVIVAGGLNFGPTHAVSLLTSLRRTPFVLFSDEWANSQSSAARRLTPIKRLAVRSAEGYITCGHPQRSFLESLGAPSEAVNVAEYPPCTLPPVAEWVQPPELPETGCPEKRLLLYFGRLVERKGVLEVVRAYERSRSKQTAPTGLVVAGDGPLRDRVRRACRSISGATAITRRLSDAEKAWLLSRATATVLPAEAEPWGIVVTESLCVGTPVVCSTDVAAGLEYVRSGSNGFLVPPRSVGPLVDRFAMLNELDNERARNAACEAVEEVTLDRQVAQFVDAIRRAGA
jgi:glycosyltransferase involved in cell wall biosynthesis